MKKLDLIIDALEISYTTEMSTSDRRLCNEALAAARELRELEPVAYQVMTQDEPMKEFSTEYMAHDWAVKQKLGGSPYSFWVRPLYALGESND